jgi:hypothetical protein
MDVYDDDDDANTGCIFSVTMHGWLGYSKLGTARHMWSVGTANKYLGYRPC